MPEPAQPLRLGTRASPLAMAQAHAVRAALLAAHGWADAAVEIVASTASGDRITDRALADLGGKALWTRELDRALAGGDIDFAVHSLKDVETLRPDALVIAAVMPRGDVRDQLVVSDALGVPHGVMTLADLPANLRFGTSSPRRAAQLRRHVPGAQVQLLRGNVATRLARIADGTVDASFLAAAGLARLGMAEIGTPLPVDQILPAAAQAAIAVECRANDDATRARLAAIDDARAHAAVRAERAFLAAVGGNCHSPVAALAQGQPGALMLRAALFSADGQAMVDGAAPVRDDADVAELAADLLGRASPTIRALFAA